MIRSVTGVGVRLTLFFAVLLASLPVVARPQVAAAEPSDAPCGQALVVGASQAQRLVHLDVGAASREALATMMLRLASASRCSDPGGGDAVSTAEYAVLDAAARAGEPISPEQRADLGAATSHMIGILEASHSLLTAATAGGLAEGSRQTLIQLLAELRAAAGTGLEAASAVSWRGTWAIAWFGGLGRGADALVWDLVGSEGDQRSPARSSGAMRSSTIHALRTSEAAFLRLLSDPVLAREHSLEFVTGSSGLETIRGFVLGVFTTHRTAVPLFEKQWTSWRPEDCGTDCGLYAWYQQIATIWPGAYQEFRTHREESVAKVDPWRMISPWAASGQAARLENNRRGRSAPPSCLESAGSEEGAAVRAGVCGDSTGQLWRFIPGSALLRQESSGRCLDVAGAPAAQVDRTGVVLAPCATVDPATGAVPAAQSDQRWSLHPAGYLVNLTAGRCLDLNAGRNAWVEPCEFDRASMPDGRDAPTGIEGSDPTTEQVWHTILTGRVDVETAGSGAGSVTSPAGVDCGGAASTCTIHRDAGSELTLTAHTPDGSVFTGWSGGCSGTSATCTVTIDADLAVVATFEPAVPFTAEATGSGAGAVVSSPAGLHCTEQCMASFPEGTIVELTAEPEPASAFESWGGDCADEGSSPICILSADQARDVTASFAPAPGLHVRTVGNGSVSSDTGGIDCGATCFADLADGTEVTLTAAAAPDSLFAAWSGACSGTGPECFVTVAESTGVTATFAPRVPVNVTLLGDGAGTVTSTPAEIACPATCTREVPKGTTVTLVAEPQPGTVFSRWEGDCTGTAPTCIVAADREVGVTARFAAAGVLSVNPDGVGGGRIVSSLAGIDCPATCVHPYALGTWIELTAEGDVLPTWSGDCEGNPGDRGTCTVHVDEDVDVGATFRPAHPMTVTVEGAGRVASAPNGISCATDVDGIGSGTCAANFDAGGDVTLVAYSPPGDGWSFAGWTGDCAGVALTCTVTADEAQDVTANFTDTTVRISVDKDGEGEGDVVSDRDSDRCVFTRNAPRTGCGFEVTPAGMITLTAKPYLGSAFAGWTGACAGSGLSCTLPATAAATATATFVPGSHVKVIPVAGTGEGVVTSDPVGIDCGTVCEADLASSAAVELTATPSAGSVFTGWWNPCEGNAAACGGISVGCAGADPVCRVPAGEDAFVVPVFDLVAGATKRRVLLSIRGQGEVDSEQAPGQGAFPCQQVCPSEFDADTAVRLTAEPSDGHVFTGWSGDCDADGYECTVTGGPTSIVAASFRPEGEANIENMVAPDVTGQARIGDTLTASPGEWEPGDVSVTYQWLRDGEPIIGATEETYAVTPDDVGARISVEVGAAREWFTAGTARSGEVGPVPGIAPTVQVRVGRRTSTVRDGRADVTVTADGEPATGQVEVSVVDASGDPVATVPATLIDGAAQVVVRRLPAGRYQLRAEYAGHAPVGSGTGFVDLVVAKVKPTIGLRVTRRPALRRKGVLQATIGSGSVRATGKVRITVRDARGKVKAGSACRLRRGTAGCALPALRSGRYRVTTSYAGDLRFQKASRKATVIVR